MTEAEKNALLSRINEIKAEVESGSITASKLGTILSDILTGLWSSLPSLTGYATQSWVSTSYAKKTDIPSLSPYLPIADVAIAIESLNKYYTKSQIDGNNFVKLSDLQIAIESLNKFYTMAQTDAKFASKASLSEYAKKTSIPSLTGYAKLSDLPSLSSYAKKSEIPSLDGVATTENLSDYMLKEDAETFHENINTRVTACEEKTKHLGIIPYSHGNANSLVNTAKYYLSEDVTNVPNLPCYIEVMGYDSAFIVQRSILIDGVIKQRIFNGTSWSAWKNI